MIHRLVEKHDQDHEHAGVEELDHVPQPGGRLTGGTVATVRDRLLEGRLLFRLNDEGIARHFVRAFFDGNPWQVGLDELREVIANLDGCPQEVPKDPGEFAQWVRKELLEFDHLPKDKLAELYEWASEDLAAIEANIADCLTAITGVERRSPKTDTDEIDVRFYRHFERMNHEARDEIVHVLAHRVEREALRAAYGPLFGLDLHVPWGFRWFPHRFQAARYSPIRHAFPELPARDLHDLEDLYDRKDMAEFDRRLDQYLRDQRPADAVTAMLNEHHLLAKRRDVILPALDAYRHGQTALFTSAVAVQIEGIFEDACILSGVAHDELRMNTLGPKLAALTRMSKVRFDYVYYAFRFPILRNRVAHGRIAEATDLERRAHMLLLDLSDVCRVVRHHPAASNTLVELLREVTPVSASVADALRFATLYSETNGEQPPEFYELATKFQEMRLVMEQDPVWYFMRSLVAVGDEELDSGLRLVLEALRTKRPALRKECDELLGGLGPHRGRGRFDRDEFWSALKGKPGSDAQACEEHEPSTA